MLFHRLDFFLFFLVVFIVYAVLRRKAQNVWLLIASYYFYAAWDWRFLGLLLLSTLVDFLVGWALGSQRGRAKVWLAISVIVNLGILAAFKYADFFVDNFVALASLLGVTLSPRTMGIIIPVGISFYTFQSMSYTIDVYRGQTTPLYPVGPFLSRWHWMIRTLSSFSDFALYVSFFPQLVAGPIERSTRLLGQVLSPRHITMPNFGRGCWLFFLGLAMKIAIADEIAPQVDAVYADLSSCSILKLYMATVAFALQIYCDFAGYSYMARGVASMMGFDLMINFRQPYLASSFADFWRRWHISLSTWIRDYLYIPLGGSRLSSGRTYVNLLLVMGLAGLWHGSTWAFALWGLLHGTFLVIERALRGKIIGKTQVLSGHRLSALARLAYGAVVFNGVLLGWFFFRVGDLSAIMGQWSRLPFSLQACGLRDLPFSFPDALPFLSFAALLLVYELPCRWKNVELFPGDLRFGHRLLLYLSLIVMLLAAGGQKDAPFIYFQF